MSLWLALGIAVVLVIYIVLRLAFVYYICGGGNPGLNYYSDSEK